MEDNFFRCKGKLAGRLNKRATPGGVVLEDIIVAVASLVPWKQKKIAHLKITCGGDVIQKLYGIKTGDVISVQGVIEEIGKEKQTRLIAIEIEKEKNNE